MNLEKNLSSSLEYAKKMIKDAGRWILLIVLGVIPIVNLLVLGYWARVVKETPASDEPPRLQGYGSMWIQGLKIMVAALIYMIIPIILIVSGATMALPWGIAREPVRGLTSFPFFSGIALSMFIVAIVVSFLIAIIATMGIVHMIKENKFSKAFAISDILNIIKGIGWGPYLLWLITIFVISMIYGIIGGIPYVGGLITLILLPLFMVFTARSMALTYEESGKAKPESGTLIEPTRADYKFCVECGVRIATSAKYCPECGAKQ
ncbi:MAG: DUF4013 domain-containing protein [Thermoproteota archaeon]